MEEKKQRLNERIRKNPYAALAITALVVFLWVKYWDGAAGAFVSLAKASLPLVVGCIIAYMVNILMETFERLYSKVFRSEAALRWRRAIAIVFSFFFLILIIVLVLRLVVPQLKDCVQLLIADGEGAMKKLANLLKSQPMFAQYGEWIQVNLIDDADPQMIVNKGISLLKRGASGWTDHAIGVAQQIVSVATTIAIGLFFSVYVLAGKERLAGQCKRLLHLYLPQGESRILYVLRVFHESFRSFIVGQVKDAVVFGLMCTVGLLILRMPYAMMIGVILTVAALVPIIGSTIGSTIGAILILSVSPMKALIFIIFFLIMQQVDNSVTYPRIVGSSIGLPGIWVLAAVTVGGSMFGVLGMLFFIPLFSALYRLLREHAAKKEALQG